MNARGLSTALVRFLLGLGLCEPASAAVKAFNVRPGDLVEVQIQINNAGESSLDGVRLLATLAEGITSGSNAGPVQIPAGQSSTLSLNLSISESMPSGVHVVTIVSTMTTTGVSPDPT